MCIIINLFKNMKKVLFKEKYPVFTLDILKIKTDFTSVNEIISYFQEKISDHPVAVFISIFDHFTHTKNLETSGKGGEIHSEILDAKNIVFCFGKELPTPLAMAVRPRSIGVAEFSDKFVISFMETPNPASTDTLKEWVNSVLK